MEKFAHYHYGNLAPHTLAHRAATAKAVKEANHASRAALSALEEFLATQFTTITRVSAKTLLATNSPHADETAQAFEDMSVSFLKATRLMQKALRADEEKFESLLREVNALSYDVNAAHVASGVLPGGLKGATTNGDTNGAGDATATTGDATNGAGGATTTS